MKRLVTAFVLLAAASIGAIAKACPVPSYWRNHRGSEMKIYSIDALGNFKGISSITMAALPARTHHSIWLEEKSMATSRSPSCGPRLPKLQFPDNLARPH